MDEIVSFFPEPTAHGPMHTADGGEVPFSTDGRRRGPRLQDACPTPTSGRLNFVKVVSGTLKPGHRARRTRAPARRSASRTSSR